MVSVAFTPATDAGRAPAALQGGSVATLIGNAIEALIALLDALGGDPDLEEDDPAGQCDEDGVNTGHAVFYLHGVAQTGPGCILSDNDSPPLGEVHPNYGEDQSQPPLNFCGRSC